MSIQKISFNKLTTRTIEILHQCQVRYYYNDCFISVWTVEKKKTVELISLTITYFSIRSQKYRNCPTLIKILKLFCHRIRKSFEHTPHQKFKRKITLR